MTWFKVDDQFWSHPKVVALSPDAGWLWTRAGSYCGQHLTDGFVSIAALGMLGGSKAEAAELVAAALWLDVSGGYRFHDWDKYQPTRESVLVEREEAAERMRRVRANKRANVRPNVQRDSQGTNAVGSASPSPSPSPVPIDQDSDLSVTEGDRARNAGLTDQGITSIIKSAELHADCSLTPSEAVALTEYVIANARTAVRRTAPYVRTAIEQGPSEVSAWVTAYRRRNIQAVS